MESFVIYSRKSKFTGKGESVENQVELCKKYIANNYSQEEADAAKVYEDEGYSGESLNRPRFKDMMTDLNKTKCFAIVVYKLDRISRNVGDFANLINDLSSRGISFVSIKEQFDTTTPMGRAMMYICSVFSQLERETTSERIRDNLYELAKTGRWLGGTTPLGYESESAKRVTLDGKTRSSCHLKNKPEELSIVKLIFAKFLETASLTQTDAYLLSNGFRTRSGVTFSRFAIKHIIDNPVYMIADKAAYEYLSQNKAGIFVPESAFDGEHGVMAYNRTRQEKNKTERKPVDEWVVSVGKHYGIISGEDWVKAQRILELNRSKGYKKPRSHTALLSGIIRCGNCGDYMRPKSTGRLTADGQEAFSYLCTTKERSRSCVCAMKNPSGNLVDKLVIEEIKKIGFDKAELIRQLDIARKKISDERSSFDAELAAISKSISDKEEQINILIISLAKAEGTVAEKYILDNINKANTEIESLKSRQEYLLDLSRKSNVDDTGFDVVRDMLSSFSDSIDNYSFEQKKAAVRACVDKVVWDGEKIDIYFFGSEDDSPCSLRDVYSKSDDDNGEPLCEDSKCYVHATAVSGKKNKGEYVTSNSSVVFSSDKLSVIRKYSRDTVTYSPFITKSVKIEYPLKQNAYTAFFNKYPTINDAKTVGDKLKWLRHSKLSLQTDLCGYLQIDRVTYIRYEANRAICPLDLLTKISDYYNVDVMIFLDDYNKFLYVGQSKLLRALRKSTGLTQIEYSKKIGVLTDRYKNWERGDHKVTRPVYEQYFKAELTDIVSAYCDRQTEVSI